MPLRLWIPFPIKAEQVLRLNENKDFSYAEAQKDFGFTPLAFEGGVKSGYRSEEFMEKFSVEVLVVTILMVSCSSTSTPPSLPTSTVTALSPSADTPEAISTFQDESSSPLLPTSQYLIQLLPLTLPEFNARYVTRDLAVTPDKQILAVISQNKMDESESIWLWKADSLTYSLVSYQSVVDNLQSLAFSPDGKKLAIGGKGKIVILDWKTGAVLDSILFSNSNLHVSQIGFGPNDTLLSSNFKGTLTVWDLMTKEAKYTVVITPLFSLSGFIVSPDGTTLVTGMDKEIHIRDYETGQIINTIHNPDNTFFTEFAFSSDGKLIATGGCKEFGFEACAGGQLLIWNSSFESISINISNYPSNFGVVEFSPNGGSLAILNSGIVEILKLDSGQTTRAPSLIPMPWKIPPDNFFYVADMGLLSNESEIVVSTSEGLQFLDVASMSWAPNLQFILGLGYSYLITDEGDNVNFRLEPSINGMISRKLHVGESFTVVNGPKVVDGYVWWKVEIKDATKGWIVEMPGWYEFIP